MPAAQSPNPNTTTGRTRNRTVWAKYALFASFTLGTLAAGVGLVAPALAATLFSPAIMLGAILTGLGIGIAVAAKRWQDNRQIRQTTPNADYKQNTGNLAFKLVKYASSLAVSLKMIAVIGAAIGVSLTAPPLLAFIAISATIVGTAGYLTYQRYKGPQAPQSTAINDNAHSLTEKNESQADQTNVNQAAPHRPAPMSRLKPAKIAMLSIALLASAFSLTVSPLIAVFAIVAALATGIGMNIRDRRRNMRAVAPQPTDQQPSQIETVVVNSPTPTHVDPAPTVKPPPPPVEPAAVDPVASQSTIGTAGSITPPIIDEKMSGVGIADTDTAKNPEFDQPNQSDTNPDRSTEFKFDAFNTTSKLISATQHGPNQPEHKAERPKFIENANTENADSHAPPTATR